MRLPDFWAAMQAYQEQVRADRQHMGDLVRCATMTLFNLQVKPGSRFKRVEDFWPMPWDPPKESAEDAISKLSDDERQTMIDNFIRHLDG